MGMNNHVSPKGILAVLNSENPQGKPKSVSAIRRTLSADMSSDQWRNQNQTIINFKDDEALRHPGPPFDSSSSSFSSSSDGEDDDDDDFQKSIRKSEDSGGWLSILQGGKTDGCSVDLPPPPVCVHPMVKRSASCLSEKSLELCTENLGSETGSELGHRIKEEDGDWVPKETNQFVELNVSKYTKSTATAVKPLPPPIPSIAVCSLRIHSRRRNGRLVLEAVSVPPKRCFRAERGDGRLILSLIGAQSEETDKRAVEERLPMATVRKTGPPPLPPPAKKLTKQHRQLSNEISKEREEEFELSMLQSLPPSARLRRTMIRINVYEYFWRKTGVSAGGGGGGGFGPYCIATS